MSPRRMICSLLLLLPALACTSWKPSRLIPEQAVKDRQDVRVQLSDGSRVQVHEPWVRNDSLGGVVRDGAWAVPLIAVAEVQTTQVSLWKTIGLAAGGVYVVTGVVTSVAAIVSQQRS